MLDELLATFSVDFVLSGCLLPFLGELRRRRRQREISVAQEQFSTPGPLAAIASGSGELDRIALLSFGLTLRSRGWRIVGLGRAANADAIAEIVSALSLEIVVLLVHRRRLSGADVATIDRIAQNAVVALSGDPASCAAAESLDVGLLGSDPVSAAVALALGHLGARRSPVPEPVTERELRIPRQT